MWWRGAVHTGAAGGVCTIAQEGRVKSRVAEGGVDAAAVEHGEVKLRQLRRDAGSCALPSVAVRRPSAQRGHAGLAVLRVSAAQCT